MSPSFPSARSALALLLLSTPFAGCSSADSSSNSIEDSENKADAGAASTASSGFEIVNASGGPQTAFAGDTLRLKVVRADADGSVGDLPSGAVVVWTAPAGVSALPHGSGDPDPLPFAQAEATAAWVVNPSRPDIDLTNVLVVLDPGTIQNATLSVTATITGEGVNGQAQTTIQVFPSPAGDWNKGAVTYAATCAACHGATGHGSVLSADGVSYLINGVLYPYPAPGINAEPGNMAGDLAWSTALLAVAARIDVDNAGAALRLPMPAWEIMANAATGELLTTQDFADIYAFLKTQAQ